jgi:hypothetical protein
MTTPAWRHEYLLPECAAAAEPGTNEFAPALIIPYRIMGYIYESSIIKHKRARHARLAVRALAHSPPLCAPLHIRCRWRFAPRQWSVDLDLGMNWLPLAPIA